MTHRTVTMAEVLEAAEAVGTAISNSKHTWPRIYGVPRGGIPAAAVVLASRTCYGMLASEPENADIFIDDIEDSGATRRRYEQQYPGVPFYTLFNRATCGDDFLVFPWEGSVTGAAEDIPTRLLQFIGEDPTREGLRETPARFLKAWSEYTSGYAQDPAEVFKTFVDGADKVDELVLVRDIRVQSHCEHHLAPFQGVAHLAYIPNGRVLGLSKFARLVDVFARRLQVQERLTQQIAHAMQEHLQPLGVGVVLECQHACMELRGVRMAGSTTTTSCLLGALKDRPEARAEFMRLVR